jgi:hypothetical protein
MMRILVTGSRDLRSVEAVKAALLEVTAGHRGPHTLVHGNARGADQIAAVVARRLGWQIEPHPANWAAPCRPECEKGHRRARGNGTEYCPAAGVYRNQQMVDLGADVCVAFLVAGAGNVGTRDCISRAKTASLKVREVTV